MILQDGVSYWRLRELVVQPRSLMPNNKVVVVGRRIDEGEETVRLIKEASERLFCASRCHERSRC